MRRLLAATLLCAAAGFALWFPSRNVRYDMRLRDGFLVVTMTWVFASGPGF